MACDFRAANWGKAFNSHCGCGLGPGHAPTPLVSSTSTEQAREAGRQSPWRKMDFHSAGGSQFLRIRRGILGLAYSGWLGRFQRLRKAAIHKRHIPVRAAEHCPLTSIPALPCREGQGPLEILQLDFEMENFTSQSVKRRIMWHIDYRGHGALPDLERAVTELTVIQRDVQAILPLAMVSRPRKNTSPNMAYEFTRVCGETGQD